MYSSACRSHVLEHFNELDRYDEYVDLYEDIIRTSVH